MDAHSISYDKVTIKMLDLIILVTYAIYKRARVVAPS